jgi:predicted MFS family arabinose efflux permease
MMVPVGRLIVLRSVPRSDLVSALAWLTIPALIGPVLGPPLGGFITTFFDWRWIFWINIPIAVLGFALVTLLIPDIRIDTVRSFDLGGFLLLGPGLGAFLTGVTLAGLGLSPDLVVWMLSLGGLALLLAYVPHALSCPDPIVDLRLVRLRTFRVGVTGGTLFRIGVGALPLLLPLMFQIGFGLSAFQSGMLTFVAGLGAFCMKFLAQPILRRFGFRRVLVVNGVVSAVFLLAPASFTPQTPWLWMMVLLFLGGLSRSLQFTSINALGYSDVSAGELSSATSFSSVLQQLSWSIGITVAAFGLETMQVLQGKGPLSLDYFPAVFAGIALVSLLSVIPFARLSPTAGAALLRRGHDSAETGH